MLEKVKQLTSRITMNLLGIEFRVRVERDNLDPENGRIFLQIVFDSPCTKTNEVQEWHGRKWYLSEHMPSDEVIKTAYAAFKMCVEHEVMKSFKVDGIILFNPHVNFEELLKVSHREVTRQSMIVGFKKVAERHDIINGYIERGEPVPEEYSKNFVTFEIDNSKSTEDLMKELDLSEKKEYNYALKVIKAYEADELKKFDEKVIEIQKELDVFFKGTYIKEYRINKANWLGTKCVEIVSINPRFDEDYGGEFDEALNVIGQKYGVYVGIEAGASPK